MEVLNDSFSHKQYPLEYMELGTELKGFDSSWDATCVHMPEPQACACLPAAAKSFSSSAREASSRTGSPNESLLSNEAGLMQDLLWLPNPKNTSVAGILSCQPHIRKSSKRVWKPSSHNAVKEELKCLLNGSSSPDEFVYAIGTPSVMNHTLKMDISKMYTGGRVSGGLHGKDEKSPLIQSYGNDKLDEKSPLMQSYGNDKLSYLYREGSPKQSLEDDSLAYAYTESPVEACTSISLASSENSTSDNLLGSSENLQPVAYDQSTVFPSLETWFEDQSAHMPVVQTYINDENFIDCRRTEEAMVNDGGEHPPYGYNRPAPPHPRGFLADAVCHHGNNSMPTALNESIEAPGHLRIDFEDNYYTQPHNLAQFRLPKPILGPPNMNNTVQSLHDVFNTSSASFNGVAEKKKLLGSYMDSVQHSNMYVKSSCSYGSEGGIVQQNQISVKKEDDGSLDLVKTRGLGTYAMNVCSQFDLRVRSNYPETRLVHLFTAGAEALVRRDTDSASVILGRLKDMVSSSGNTLQRVVAYFIDSLEHPAGGAAKRMHIKSQGDVLAAFQILHEIFPYIKFAHFTANQAILEAVQGARRVHVVDFEIMEGIQWPAFMQALVSRHGGPSELRITALCRPHWDHGLAMVQKTGKRLSEFASALGLSFSFHILETECDERFDPERLRVSEGEVLVVNCMVHLPHMPRRSVASVASFLHGMRTLSPAIVTAVEEEPGGCNATAGGGDGGVASYLTEALYHFHAMCDSLEACLPSDAEVEARMLVERVFMVPRIDSAVMMWRRQATVRGSIELCNERKWSVVMRDAGFTLRPLSQHSHSQAKLLLGLHKNGFYLEERSHYLVLGWQSRPLFAASVWN